MSISTNSRVAVGASPQSISNPDLGWVRHDGASEWWHAIDAVACGAYQTSCNGSMSITAPHDLEARPAIGDRCRRCQALRAHRRLVDAGLIELTENAP